MSFAAMARVTEELCLSAVLTLGMDILLSAL
jgi:hypothetical protein